MHRLSSLPWFFLILGSTVLAAAGPGMPARTRPQPQRSEIKSQPAPAPAPQASAKRAAPKPAVTKPFVSKPAVAKSESSRPASLTSAPARSTATASTKASGTAGAASRESARRGAGTDASGARRSLRECDLWLAAAQTQHAEYAGRLVLGTDEIERIEENPAFSALPSNRNRKEAAIPAAEALRDHGQRDWQRQLAGMSRRSTPVQVEQLMKQGESIAFRTQTSTSDTQGLVARIRRTPGVAAGWHLGMEAAAPDLMIGHLRSLPLTFQGSPERRPYAVDNVEGLRAQLIRGKANLDEQFNAVRQDWAASITRADELQRKYRQLQAKLVAPDE